MKKSGEDCYNFVFFHIYIEKKIAAHPRVRRILDMFPNSTVIWIDHYKDVFCRSGQNFTEQKCSQSLILAKKEGNLVYEGARVCQSFENEWFYYTSCVMNCIYDCEYCYLRGMYSSAHMVLFVNLEDILEEVERLLREHPVYLCVSYDTDLVALESVFGYAEEWIAFAGKHKELTIELRTKSGNTSVWNRGKAAFGEPQGEFSEVVAYENIIAAYTLSPQAVIDTCEHKTVSLSQRLHAAKAAWEAGFSVRFCFDPMIYLPDWKQIYGDFFEEVFQSFPAKRLQDVSLGGFRISKEYLKKMRKQSPDCAIVQFPFKNQGGVYYYPERLEQEMLVFARTCIGKYVPDTNIFEERAQRRA